MISAIKNDNGEWLENRQEIGEYLIEKFTELYKREPTTFCDCFDDFFQEKVSNSYNRLIDAIPSADEIFRTVKSMHPIKAPRPDGMPALFFQEYWRTVGTEVITMIQNAFRSAKFRRR